MDESEGEKGRKKSFTRIEAAAGADAAEILKAARGKKKCRHCASMIPKEAFICPHCRKPQTLAAILKTVPILLICGFGLYLCHQFNSSTSEQSYNAARTGGEPGNSNGTSSPPETATEVNIGRLVSAYEDNEVSADMTYKGKLLAITGIIGAINKNVLDNPYVVLNTYHVDQWGYMRESLNTVTCNFDATSGLANLHKGQKITVVGRCTGKTMWSVFLKHCSLSTQADSLVGKYPRDILSTDYGKHLEQLIERGQAGQTDSKWNWEAFQNAIATQGPITDAGDFVVGSGCLPHACPQTGAAFAIDKASGKICAVMVDNGTAVLWGLPYADFNQAREALPQPLKDWLSQKGSFAADSGAKPSETGPQQSTPPEKQEDKATGKQTPGSGPGDDQAQTQKTPPVSADPPTPGSPYQSVAHSAPHRSPPYYWYYCRNPQGYYPYLTSCPGGWVQVIPTEQGR